MTKFLASVKNYDETKIVIDTPCRYYRFEKSKLRSFGQN